MAESIRSYNVLIKHGRYGTSRHGYNCWAGRLSGLVVVIGHWGSKLVSSGEDFFLEGEQLPGWALALSERSSGMSGWLLLGVPGLAWSVGLSAVWVLVGTTGGAIFQWVVYARPFMEGRKETGAITPIGLLAENSPATRRSSSPVPRSRRTSIPRF